MVSAHASASGTCEIIEIMPRTPTVATTSRGLEIPHRWAQGWIQFFANRFTPVSDRSFGTDYGDCYEALRVLETMRERDVAPNKDTHEITMSVLRQRDEEELAVQSSGAVGLGYEK